MIDRAVKLAMATSSATSAALLVGFNLIPLAGVLFWGWNVATILVLYWVENGIIGLLNIPKILLASAPSDRSGPAVTPALSGIAEKAAIVPFFLIHYGIFWFVHGVFVFALPMFAGPFASMPGPGGDPGINFGPGGDPGINFGPDGSLVPIAATPVGPDMTAVAWGAIGLAISRIASFFINYIGNREYLKVSPAQQMFAPYGRLVILHLTILFGAFLSLSIGSPVGAIVVLVIVKTAADLGFHLREHGMLTGARR